MAQEVRNEEAWPRPGALPGPRRNAPKITTGLRPASDVTRSPGEDALIGYAGIVR